MPPKLELAFTLSVNLSPPLDFGPTSAGHRRFIPIVGGHISGPKLQAEILPGGGDWNAVRADGTVHLFAKYAIKTHDGVLINVQNEGFGRVASPTPSLAEGDISGKEDDVAGTKEAWKEATKVERYVKTWPRFEVGEGKYGWMNGTCFVGDLLPSKRPDLVEIEVYEIL